MVFETVYRVPDSVLKGQEGARFLRQDDLQHLEACNLLYFLRKSNYNLLFDYPCMGGLERRLHSSGIGGPYESSSRNCYTTQRTGSASESATELLELLVPVTLMPVEFKAVSLAEYGTKIDANTLYHLRIALADKRSNPQRIMKIGKRILENLHVRGEIERIPDQRVYLERYKGFVDDCLLEFTLGLSDSYPAVEVSIFGKSEDPRLLITELGVRELGEQFSHYDRDIVIKDSVRRGATYNLILDGKGISDVIASENIVI